MWRHLLTRFTSYKVPPVMVSTHGSVVPLAMFFFCLDKSGWEVGCKIDFDTEQLEAGKPIGFETYLVSGRLREPFV